MDSIEAVILGVALTVVFISISISWYSERQMLIRKSKESK